MIKAPRASANSVSQSRNSLNDNGADGLMMMNTTKKSKRYQSVRRNDNDHPDGIFRIDDSEDDDFVAASKSNHLDGATQPVPYSDNDKSENHDDDGNAPRRAGLLDYMGVGCCSSSSKNRRQRVHWSHVREQIGCMIRMGLPYFIESRQAKILVIKLIFFLLLDNGVDILYSFVNRDFWNALSEQDADKFSTALIYYITILLVMAPIDAMYMFQQHQLQLHWRAWLTTRTIHLYTTHPVFYTLEMQRCQNDVVVTATTTTTSDTTATDQCHHDKSSCDVDTDIPCTTSDPASQKATTTTKSKSIDRTRGLIDNPDQRISEDVAEFTRISIDLCFELVSSMIQLCSFSIILYSIYPQLLYIGFLYAFGATVTTTVVFHPLIQLNVDHLKFEANLRYALVRFRENVEAIAFYKSSSMEQQYIISQLMNVVANQYNINILTRLYNFFTFAFNLTRSIVPVVIVAPKYFAGKIEMGVINQSTGAFSQVVGSLSMIVNGFDTISPYAANIERLSRFYQAMAKADMYKQQNWTEQERMQHLLRVAPTNVVDSPKRFDEKSNTNMFHDNADFDQESTCDIEMSTVDNNPTENNIAGAQNVGVINMQRCVNTNDALQIKDLTLTTPDMKRVLIHGLDVIITKGQHLLIVGPSGVGKSSLLRAIAGLWTAGDGAIFRPRDSEIYFLPQRPYCTMGTLRDQLLYPSKSDTADEHVLDWSFRSVRHTDSATATERLLQSSQPELPLVVSDNELLQILKRINLLDIASRAGNGNPKEGLYTSMDWSNVLSMGEQQRLAFGRLLVHAPKQLVILDEATSALDVDNEALMYGILQDLMTTSTSKDDAVGTGLTYISVGHRPSLEAFHRYKLSIDGHEDQRDSGHILSSLNDSTEIAELKDGTLI